MKYTVIPRAKQAQKLEIFKHSFEELKKWNIKDKPSALRLSACLIHTHTHTHTHTYIYIYIYTNLREILKLKLRIKFELYNTPWRHPPQQSTIQQTQPSSQFIDKRPANWQCVVRRLQKFNHSNVGVEIWVQWRSAVQSATRLWDHWSWENL
jgi:hypothetical protein